MRIVFSRSEKENNFVVPMSKSDGMEESLVPERERWVREVKSESSWLEIVVIGIETKESP